MLRNSCFGGEAFFCGSFCALGLPFEQYSMSLLLLSDLLSQMYIRSQSAVWPLSLSLSLPIVWGPPPVRIVKGEGIIGWSATLHPQHLVYSTNLPPSQHHLWLAFFIIFLCLYVHILCYFVFFIIIHYYSTDTHRKCKL